MPFTGWRFADSRNVEVWRAADAGEEKVPHRISEAMGLDASPLFPGLAIDMKEVWAA